MQTEPTKIIFALGDKIIRISPPIWPDHILDVQPGDLTRFAPQGNGVYGYQGREEGSPFKDAPPHEASGGVIYFGNGLVKADFEALMRIMGVHSDHWVNPPKDFAVFTAESEQPGKDGYLSQMRIVSRFSLRYMFGALTESEYEKFPEQDLTMADTLWSFIEREQRRWGTSWMDDRGLHGKFGGDSHFACEELAFGFMLENEYHRVYRIWSRAWLVTK